MFFVFHYILLFIMRTRTSLSPFIPKSANLSISSLFLNTAVEKYHKKKMTYFTMYNYLPLIEDIFQSCDP